jgi:putative tricarboxylic transport membrane protein
VKATNLKRADFVMSIGLILFGVAVLVTSIRMPRYQEINVNPYSVPGIVPGFLGAIVGFLGIVLLVRSILRKGYALNITKDTVISFFADESTRRLLLTLAICLLYSFVLLDRIPYLAATIGFILVFDVVFEYKRGVPLKSQRRMFLLALLLSGIGGTAIWATFRYLFLVNLPG